MGGKARSLRVPKGEQERTAPKASGVPAARPALPGEHGFHFFPGFYANTFETFKQIRVEGGRKTVFDRLVTVPRLALTRMNAPTVVLDPGFADDLAGHVPSDSGAAHQHVCQLGISWGDARFFAVRIWQILTSCQERRLAEYEQITWWDYVQAAQRSKAYQDLLAEGLSRSLLANDPRTASARTVGNTNVQLLLGILLPGQTDDHVLNGPTSETSADPWREHLQRKLQGRFEVRCSSRVTGIKVTGPRLAACGSSTETSPRASGPAGAALLRGSRVGIATCLRSRWSAWRSSSRQARRRAAGGSSISISLEGILKLRSSVAAMNGVQSSCTARSPCRRLTISCVDSPWSLTADCRRTVLEGHPPVEEGRWDGPRRPSVCISNWTRPESSTAAPRTSSRGRRLRTRWGAAQGGHEHRRLGPAS